MNDCFDQYSLYYDLLYSSKDYQGEAGYLDTLLNKYCSQINTILELGSGTGKHAELLYERGYKIHGVDSSETMLAVAKKKEKPGLTFNLGDVRSYRTPLRIDAVISIFHVVSYQTSNENLNNYFTTAAEHLGPGGVLIFDFWYGPTVLMQIPEKKIKKAENDTVFVERIATPTFWPNENVVNVHYELMITTKRTGEKTQVRENHKMRYLFLPELQYMLKTHGFDLIDSLGWMSMQPLSINDWSGVVIAQKC